MYVSDMDVDQQFLDGAGFRYMIPMIIFPFRIKTVSDFRLVAYFGANLTGWVGRVFALAQTIELFFENIWG